MLAGKRLLNVYLDCVLSAGTSFQLGLLKGNVTLENLFEIKGLDKIAYFEINLITIGQKLRKLKTFEDFKIIIKGAAILNI